MQLKNRKNLQYLMIGYMLFFIFVSFLFIKTENVYMEEDLQNFQNVLVQNEKDICFGEVNRLLKFIKQEDIKLIAQKFTKKQREQYFIKLISNKGAGADEKFKILTLKYKIVWHPDRSLIGKKIEDVNSITYQNIQKVDMKKGGYSTFQTFDKRDRISYVKECSRFDWIITTGYFVKKIEDLVEKKRVELQGRIITKELFVLGVLFIALFFIFYMSYHIIIENKKHTEEVEYLNKTLESKIKKAIEKTKKQQEQMEQQNRLVQMGEMISMIAHQWRQPLNAISAASINLSLLSDMKMLEDAKIQEESTFIQNQCQKMSTTIETFMEFIKPSKDVCSFKIIDTVEAILSIISAQLTNKNIKVSIIQKQKDITLVGYENLLEQVILNILSNARDALDEIDIEDRYINIIIDKKDTIVSIKIEDNAGGIEKDVVKKIFNPYFTTKEQGKGTGIGLYMSIGIMRNSFQGDLIYSPIENGSCFDIVCGSDKS